MRLRRHIMLGCALLALTVAGATHGEAQTVDELYAAGVKARLEQRFDDAAGLLRRALALQPRNADVLVQLGFVELGRGDLAAARRHFDNAIALAPAYADARFGLAQIEYRLGNLDAALALVQPVVTQQPDNQDAAKLLQSILKAKQAQADSGKRATARQRAKAPAETLAQLMSEGRRQRTGGQFAAAERTYRKALALDPRNGDALVALGLVSGFQGEYPDAGRYFEQALALDRNNFDAQLGKVRLALWQNDVETARRRLDPIAARAPGNGEVLLLEGRVAFLEEDHERSQAAYRKALTLDPADADAMVGLGDALRAAGDDAGARLFFASAAQLRPGSEEIASRLAMPVPRQWRLDLFSEISALTSDRGTWTDNFAVLSYRASPELVAGAQTRVATRFGETDAQLEARLDYSLSRSFTAYGLLAVTPDADFLAGYSIGAGATWAIETEAPPVGALLLGLDARYDAFTESRIWLAQPWAQLYLFDDRVWLTGRWVHVEDDQDNVVDGYIARGDVMVTDRLQAFIGYSDAPEISEGEIIDTESVFGGIGLNVTDDVTLRASYGFEMRQAFDRDIYGLGLTVRF